MGLNVELLRSSFNLVVEREPTVTKRFYDIFFTRYPQVVPMFGKNSAEKQQEMLTGALVAIVDHLEDAPWLKSTLRSLGRKHEGYGVTPEMYGWVGECLLAAMSEVAGDDWSVEIAQAWTDAYGAIVHLTLND